MAGQVISVCLNQLKVMTGLIANAALEQAGASAWQMTAEQFNSIKDVEKGIEKLGSNLTAIQAVLSDAEREQIDSATTRNWLDNLKKVSQEIVDALNKWIAEINRPSVDRDEEESGQENYASLAKKARLMVSRVRSRIFSIPVHKIVLRLNVASEVKKLNERLDTIADQRRKYSFDTARVVRKGDQSRRKTTSFVDVSKVYGRDGEKENLIKKLSSDEDFNNNEDRNAFEIISIVGKEGIGKTTLAQLVYHNNEVKNQFDRRIWICASDPFDETGIAKAIVEAVDGRAADVVEMESLLHRIHTSIGGKRFLLVLDDVCTEGATKLEALKQVLKNGAEGSRILVTTRKEEVAVMMGAGGNMIFLEHLPVEVA